MKLKQYITETKVEVQLNPQKGWKEHNLQGDIEQAIYKLIRKSHKFLTDDNHTWKATKSNIKWAGKITKHKHIMIYKKNGSKWFNVEYK